RSTRRASCPTSGRPYGAPSCGARSGTISGAERTQDDLGRSFSAAPGGRRRLDGRYIRGMVEVRLRAVRVDLQSNTPVLLLQETDGEGRTLPIFIGTPEAAAIAYALQGVTMPRPMTHDLLRDLLSSLEVEIERVV